MGTVSIRKKEICFISIHVIYESKRVLTKGEWMDYYIYKIKHAILVWESVSIEEDKEI